MVALAGSWIGGAECGGIANDGRLGGGQCPHAGCLDLCASVMGFGGPLFDRAEVPPSDHLLSHAELGKDSTGAFEDGDGHAGAFGEEISRCCDASAGALVCYGGHAYCDGEYSLRIYIVLPAEFNSLVSIE